MKQRHYQEECQHGQRQQSVGHNEHSPPVGLHSEWTMLQLARQGSLVQLEPQLNDNCVCGEENLFESPWDYEGFMPIRLTDPEHHPGDGH